jgi:hypothetical protein
MPFFASNKAKNGIFTEGVCFWFFLHFSFSTDYTDEHESYKAFYFKLLYRTIFKIG